MYLETGKYMDLINRYLKYFKKENILILTLDDIISDGQGQADKIFDFLDVDRMEVDFSKRANVSTTLKYPALKTTLNKLYRFKGTRLILNKLMSLKFKEWLKNVLMGKNYKTHKYPEIDKEAAVKLQEFYKDDLVKLEEFLGRDLSAWREKY